MKSYFWRTIYLNSQQRLLLPITICCQSNNFKIIEANRMARYETSTNRIFP